MLGPARGPGAMTPETDDTAPRGRESRRAAMVPRGRGRSVGGSARPCEEKLARIMNHVMETVENSGNISDFKELKVFINQLSGEE